MRPTNRDCLRDGDAYNDIAGRELQLDKKVTNCQGVFFAPFFSSGQADDFESVTDRIFWITLC